MSIQACAAWPIYLCDIIFVCALFALPTYRGDIRYEYVMYVHQLKYKFKYKWISTYTHMHDDMSQCIPTYAHAHAWHDPFTYWNVWNGMSAMSTDCHDARHELIMYLYICVNIRINADTYRCISVYRDMYL